MPKSNPSRIQRWLMRVFNLQGVNGYLNGGGWAGGWWPGAVLESFTGAWQSNTVAAPTTTLVSFSPVFSCITGIASDVSKLRVKLYREEDGICQEITENQPWLPLLRNPNHYQDRIKFFESWMISKLMYGNTYILKQRDSRGVVKSMYVLHPGCVKPLVADDGSVYYELTRDDLSGIHEGTIEELIRRYGRTAIPASEIIHDRMNTFWHPLVGISPLYACGNSATLGSSILGNSTKFFQNLSRPGGHLTAPGTISDETAARLKALFEANFSADNIGKLLVTGDGLEFKPFAFNAENSQLKEQFEMAIEDAARAFRYPVWKLTGKMPPYTKPDQAQTQYYSDCLGSHIEAIELCLDNGLELPLGMGTEFDLDGLMRMDTQALYESINLAKTWMTPNEKRNKANLEPVPLGGDTIYLQEQDHSIEAIAKRDKAEQFQPANTGPAATAQPIPAPEPPRGLDSYELFRIIRRELPARLKSA